MHNYVYLIAALIVAPIWLVFCLLRKDLLREMIYIGLFVAVIAPITEYLWFFNDYWSPDRYVSLFSFFSQEFLFGFLIGGVASTAGKVILKQKSNSNAFSPARLVLTIGIMFASFLILTNLLGVNSIYSNYVAFLILIALAVIERPLIIKQLIISSILIFCLAIIGYGTLLLIYPSLIRDWYQINNLSGKMIYGIPVEEFIWFIIFGLCVPCLNYFWRPVKSKTNSKVPL